MSFTITLYVREGIVMASDSRLMLSVRRVRPDGGFTEGGGRHRRGQHRPDIVRSRRHPCMKCPADRC